MLFSKVFLQIAEKELTSDSNCPHLQLRADLGYTCVTSVNKPTFSSSLLQAEPNPHTSVGDCPTGDRPCPCLTISSLNAAGLT